MSVLGDIRAGLATVLAGISGIAAVSPYPTEKIGAMPHAQLGMDADTESVAGQITAIHRLPLHVMVARKGMLPEEVKAVEALIDPVKSALYANQHAGGVAGVMRVVPIATREVVFPVAGVDYVGFETTLEIKHNRTEVITP